MKTLMLASAIMILSVLCGLYLADLWLKYMEDDV